MVGTTFSVMGNCRVGYQALQILPPVPVGLVEIAQQFIATEASGTSCKESENGKLTALAHSTAERAGQAH